MDYRHCIIERYSWLMVTRRRKWDWRVFGRPGWGDFNDENPSKWLRSFPVIFKRGEEDYMRSRGIPVGGVTSMIKNP